MCDPKITTRLFLSRIVMNMLAVTGLIAILSVCSLLYYGYSIRLYVFDSFPVDLGFGFTLILLAAVTIELIRSHFYRGDLHV